MNANWLNLTKAFNIEFTGIEISVNRNRSLSGVIRWNWMDQTKKRIPIMSYAWSGQSIQDAATEMISSDTVYVAALELVQ